MERTQDEENHKRINHVLRTRTCVQMECSQDAQRASSHTVGESQLPLESYFEEHAKEVWERRWMNPETHTKLLNTKPPKLIATTLKALREQWEENDQLIAGPTPEIPLEYDQILKERKGFWDDVNGSIFQKISCRPPDVKRLHGYKLKVSTKMSRQECKDASNKLLELIGWTQTILWISLTRRFD